MGAAVRGAVRALQTGGRPLGRCALRHDPRRRRWDGQRPGGGGTGGPSTRPRRVASRPTGRTAGFQRREDRVRRRGRGRTDSERRDPAPGSGEAPRPAGRNVRGADCRGGSCRARRVRLLRRRVDGGEVRDRGPRSSRPRRLSTCSHGSPSPCARRPLRCFAIRSTSQAARQRRGCRSRCSQSTSTRAQSRRSTTCRSPSSRRCCWCRARSCTCSAARRPRARRSPASSRSTRPPGARPGPAACRSPWPAPTAVPIGPRTLVVDSATGRVFRVG